MSVDKKGDEATSLADSQVPKTPVEPDESLNTENTSLSSGTLHLEDEPDVAAEETAGNSCAAAIEAPADESNGTILEWLTSLTVEEQTAAMGFVDEAFLSAFMAVVPSIQPETSTEATNEGWSLDWDSQVLIKDIELQYTGAMNRVSRKVEGTSRLIDDDDSNVAKRVDTMHQRFSSDVFRIRKFSEPSSCGSSLLENVRLVLPSAVQHALGKSVDGLAPFVTVIPEFLEKVGVEEVFNALFSSDIDDEGFLMSSLLVTAEASSPPLWLKLVSKRHPDSETTALSNLVLERFRQQILFSYLEFRASVCARRSETQGKGTNEPSAFAEDSAPPSSWLADVISTALSLSYLAESMEPVRLAECLEPVVSLLPSTKLNAACLIFTPMDCLAFAKGDISISRLDAANAKSLKLISHSLLSDVRSPINEEAIRDETYNSDEGCLLVLNPDGNTTPTSRDVNFASGSKKKKKKTKKRKNRRSLVAATEVVQTEDSNVEVGHPVENSTKVAPVDVTRVAAEMPVLEADQESIKMELSVDSDDSDVSTKTELQPSTQGDSIIVSCGNGFVVVSPTPMPAVESSVSHAIAPDENSNVIGEDGDEDVWETVEVRSRGTRKKTPGAIGRNGQASFGNQASSTGSQVDFEKRNKVLRAPITRKKSAARKVAREVVFSLLDSVDDEAIRRHRLEEATRAKQQHNPSLIPSRTVEATNPWNKGPPSLGGASHSTPSQLAQSKANNGVKQVASLRDVVLGLHTSSVRTRTPAVHVEKKPISFANAVSSPVNPLSRAKLNGSSGADQNTAPTYQETASSHSNNQTAVKSCPTSVEERASKSDSSSAETEDVPQEARLASAHGSKPPVPAPPLPTMLSAENPNSANSSVASSLEVPHSSRRHHHHHTTTTGVNDVGYHLLDVCDRLSQDMNLFMSRRSLALNARRRERGALLSALQSTVASLWPNRGHVEMYGSCATYLDLPSSDLDVVVIGLDRAIDRSLTVSDVGDCQKSSDNPHLQSSGDGAAEELVVSSLVPTIVEESQFSLPVSLGPYTSMQLPKNAERVVRLAAALESQPWAVQIKSIPTASVPVIKILADPSKLTGTASVSEWLNSQEHFASQAAAAAGCAGPESSQPHDLLPFQPLWRGADVMNGLLKLDITFEGPEHGGIGSTQFSSRVVTEACQESGLNPDATPLVQVIMVLKEILAQRKLNEPYSGGLSSYALLLLVVALLQERAVIREEIERSERQRQAMASGDSNSFVEPIPTVSQPCASFDRTGGTTSSPKLGGTWADHAKMPVRSGTGAASFATSNGGSRPVTNSKQASAHSEQQPTKPSDDKPPAMMSSKSASSSWASIAKINQPETTSKPLASKPSTIESQSSGLYSKPTFADAVSGATSNMAMQRRSLQEKSNSAAGNTGSARETETLGSNRPPQTEVSTTPNLTSKGCGASTPSPSLTMDTSIGAPSFYPQGYNDVIEVLCSGETTAGKLLMHFLLYYGQHFDAQSTAIDISGKHERDFGGHVSPYSYYSPFIPRRSAGVIDPVTGMLTVEPIVIYDPLEGSENNNVARRCFAWSSVRWVFAQSYATLSSAVERSSTPPTTPGGAGKTVLATEPILSEGILSSETMGDLMDPSSPLLRCLLSF